MHGSVVKLQKDEAGWQLKVNGNPIFIKGLIYTVDPIGDSAYDQTLRDWAIIDDDHDGRNDPAYQSWVDANLNNERDPDEKDIGDFQLLKNLGCNAIRVYHHSSDDEYLMTINHHNPLNSHAPNKALYRELHAKTGIWIMMGDLVGAYTVGTGAKWENGTDYRDSLQRENILKSVKTMIKDFKDEPYILMWALGNENDYVQFTQNNSKQYPEVYARFVNDIAKMIHKLDPNHPVCLVNGDKNFLRKYAHLIPDIDIMGFNNYSTPTFGDLWNISQRAYNKPVILTEYGTGYPPVKMIDSQPVLNEEKQAQMHKGSWNDMITHSYGQKAPGNCLGGFIYTWMDNWWEDGNPKIHDLAPNGWHHEWNGLVSQGNGQHSPLMRQLRKVYFTYQDLWTADRSKN